MLFPAASTGQSRRSAAEIPRRSSTSLTVFTPRLCGRRSWSPARGVRSISVSPVGRPPSVITRYPYSFASTTPGTGTTSSGSALFTLDGSADNSQFSYRPLGGYARSQFNFSPLARSALLRCRQRQQCLGLVEIQRGTDPLRSRPQNTPLQCGVHGAKALQLHGNARFAGPGGRCPSPSSHGLAGKEDAGQNAGQLTRPPRLLVACNRGHPGQLLGDPRLELLHLRQQRVAHPVASKGQLLVCAVLAPGLPTRLQVRDDLGAAHLKQRPDNPATLSRDNRRDAAQTFRPCAAQQLHQDRLRLIIQRVGSRDSIDLPRGKQLIETAVAQRARRLFDSAATLRRKRRDIAVLRAQWNVELARQIGDELRIAIRLSAAQAVVHMNGREHDSRLGAHPPSPTSSATESAPPETATATRSPG